MKHVLFAILIGGLGMTILLSLAIWQYQRLLWKQDVLELIETRIHKVPIGLPAEPDPERDAYLAVHLKGQLSPQELHVYTVHERYGPGYRVISAFEISQGRSVMVDRGYIRAKDKTVARTVGQSEITGNLLWPDEANSMTPSPDREGNLWYARDVIGMAQVLDAAPILVVVRDVSDGGANGGIIPMPVSTVLIPNNHLQYMLTWGALALVWGGMTGLFLLRSRSSGRA